jgi:hypothetical protein
VKPTASAREIEESLNELRRQEDRMSRFDFGAQNSRIAFARGMTKADRRAAYDQWLARGYLSPRDGSPPPVASHPRDLRAPSPSSEALSDWHHQTAWTPLKKNPAGVLRPLGVRG